MPTGGTLTLRTGRARAGDILSDGSGRAPGPYSVLSIGDSGFGMTESVRAHIFEPFFSTKGADKGAGLGLSAVQGIIHQSGGEIRVVSEPAMGSTFLIYLPEVEDSGGGAPAITGAAYERGTETILLVEEEALVRQYCRAILAGQGYQVLEAEDAKSALDLMWAARDDIHLLVTDLVLPGVEGQTVVGQFLGEFPNASVLFISGFTEAPVMLSGPIERRIRFLEKPFNMGKLLAEVRACLETEVPT